MEDFHASIYINASKEKVWHTMLDKESYREWTKAFQEGSYYEGNWEKGSKITFLGPDPETGKTGGMVSEVVENRPYDFVSVKHVAIINDGEEDSTSEEAKKWVPAHENYTFVEKDGGTEVSVDMEVKEENIPMFEKMWADAFVQLKNIAEQE